MLKLYGRQYGQKIARASFVNWYLEELGIPYEFVLLDMDTGEHRQPPFLSINPMGKAPAIVDGDFKLWESGAILLYLAEKNDRMPQSVEERSLIYQWILFANSTLAPALLIEANQELLAPNLLAGLNQVLANQSYLIGDEFTIADISVGSILAHAWLMLKSDFSSYPALLNYIKQVTERPAFQKTIGLAI